MFYTIHMEDPTTEAPAEPKAGVVAGLDLLPDDPGHPDADVAGSKDHSRSRDDSYGPTATSPTRPSEGTARELLRTELASPIHPLGEMTFNLTARRGDPDWRVMYVGAGDAGTGEQKDIRRGNPQRLDTLNGKILRIIPDLREHAAVSTVSENGRYRIPNDNPSSRLCAQGSGVGVRNPHRLIWDVDPAQPRARA